jgi:hypothetical protein
VGCSIEITGWQENISMYQTGKHIESKVWVTTRKQLDGWFVSSESNLNFTP